AQLRLAGSVYNKGSYLVKWITCGTVAMSGGVQGSDIHLGGERKKRQQLSYHVLLWINAESSNLYDSSKQRFHENTGKYRR
ncbi:MAG TPA: hypothetical protein QGI30_08360, partial [Anaerolineales bacterium]|nr:hypothetical protein [Anaerolineales bacterium]